MGSATWQFSLTDALFSVLLMAVLIGGHWDKLQEVRTVLMADVSAVRAELEPIRKSLTMLTSNFLADKIDGLEQTLKGVAVRLRPLEDVLKPARKTTEDGGMAPFLSFTG